MYPQSTTHLVTGGCGFVGRHLTRRLLDAGADIHVVDTFVSGSPPETWAPNPIGTTANSADDQSSTRYEYENGSLTVFECDVREFFERADGEASYDYVWHLAAIIGGRSTIEGEPLKVATDLSIDSQFFNWAIDHRPGRILYASSSAAYPTHLQNGSDPVKLREDHVRFEPKIGSPDMTYGWSKLTGEYLARTAASEYGLSVAVIRPFSGYGEDQSFDYPIPSIARRAHHQEDPLIIWGSGRQVRDFIYIDDCIDAMLRAVDQISDGSAVNVGTGTPTDFIEVAETFADLAGYDPSIETLPEKPEGPRFRCAETTRMKNELNWEPAVSIRDGFEAVLNGVAQRIE
ncbi:epimerase [Natronococcus pandeyae]|uniref:Epimerase n=2 Tax=Natronococcus pandeyae TaxID=2055836 RepID=A0A8J8PX15_9EURY|nr:epimerase [Natronococcus pandeyae]